MLSLAFTAALLAQDSGPAVPAFERFGAKDPAEGGRLLLGELGCVSCHRTEGGPEAKKAPLLSDAGSRFRADWLRAWIADPAAKKPGTTMPAGAERADIEPLVHYLMSLKAAKPFEGAGGAAGKAKDVYAEAGCVACHAPFEQAAKGGPGLVPQGDLKEKYASAAALAAFLQDPLRWRPSGRMPKMSLTAQEAMSIAAAHIGLPPRAADDAGETVPGVTFEAYEGSWSKLPDFDALKPVLTGTASGFHLPVAKREDHFGLRFRGYVEIPRDGLWTFTARSDDGSRLRLGRMLVVDNDGTHGSQDASGSIQLGKGRHAITVEFFEAGGGEELIVSWEGPGQPKEVLPAKALSRPREGPLRLSEEAAAASFTADPALVQQGRAIFNVKCVSCHTAEPNEMKVASIPLAALKNSGGCLADAPPAGAPRYGLSKAQTAAIAAALDAPAAGGSRLDRTMAALNCYACHERGGKGGVDLERNALFLGTDPTIGDEGRLPPHLNGAGNKLQRKWLEKVLADGTKVRPYMLTRMPAFGAANVGHLAEDFEKADLQPASPAPPKDPKLVQGGRQLTGTKGLSCITCHTFSGHKSLGIPGMDLSVMGQRLRRDWFLRYLLEPNVLRPGTRMPTYWPEGKSVLKTVFEGDAALQREGLWQYLSEGANARLPAGIGPEPILLTAKDEALIYRNFIQGAGPRAIGVGYPERVNLAFDANHFRLALAWRGDFIDASKHWIDRGAGFQGPAGEDVVAFPDAPPFSTSKGAWPASPKPPEQTAGYRFVGYDLDARGRPTFIYEWGGYEVRDFFEPAEKGLKRTLTLVPRGSNPEGAVYRAAAAKKIEKQADGTWRCDALGVRLEGPVEAVEGALLVPLVPGKKNVIVQTYRW
jgi:mono/diheme cytochrome c family protein